MTTATKQSDSNVEFQLLAKKLELMELEQKRRDLETQTKSPKSKPWWASVVEFLALPAAVIAIVFQFTQASGNVQTAAKTEAETSKIRVEEVKARVELQKMLDELAGSKEKGITAYRSEIEKALPRLQETVERLQLIESQSKAVSLEMSLAKYVLLWVLFHFVGLIFDVVYQVWSALTDSLRTFLFGLKLKDKNGNDDHKRREKMIRYYSWFDVLLRPVPTVLRWSIQLSIFLALMIPLFNEISFALGHRTSFEEVMAQAKELEFGVALSTMKKILFGIPG